MREVSNQDFAREVLGCRLPVCICFVTEWCQSCYPTCLALDQLANEYGGAVKFVKMDMDVNRHYH